MTQIGPGVVQVTMPIPFPLKEVHCYFIETADGWVMMDAGFPSEDALTILRDAVGRICGDAPKIRTAIISHYHPDHCGLAGWLEGEFGTEIVIHELDWPNAQRMSSEEEPRPEDFGNSTFAKMMQETKFSFEEMRQQTQRVRFPVKKPTLVNGTETLRPGGRELRLIWTPGHTEGHLCMLDVRENVIFTGDHMLERITPHIGMWSGDGANPLHRYEESLELIEGMAPRRGLPAHETPIEDPAERARELRRHHEERRQHVLDALSSTPRLGKAIAGSVFRGRDEPMQQFLALSETLVHLEALIIERRVTAEDIGGDMFYRLA